MNGYQTFLMTLGACAFPLYFVYSWYRQAITLRDPSGSTTTYGRAEEPRSFYLGMGIMGFGTALCWGYLLA